MVWIMSRWSKSFMLVKSRLKSTNGKILFGNFSYLLLLQIASYIFPLITLPYLAKTIAAAGFGKIAFAAAIVSWAQTVCDWGFSFTATRDVAKDKNNKELVSHIISNVTWARILLTIVCAVILILLMLFIPLFRDNSLVISLTFLMVPGHILFPDWFFQAIEKMQYITILSVLSKLGCLLAIFAFVKGPADYYMQPLFISLGYVFSGGLAIYYILFKWKYKLYKPNCRQVKKVLSESADVFINNLAPNFYNSFSTMLLGGMCGNVATGKLDAGSKFAGALQQFMQVIFKTFFPFLSRRIDKHGFFAKMSMMITIVLCVVLYILSPAIINVFFTDEFVDSVAILRIYTVSVIFLSMSIVYGTNYLIIIHKERDLRNITMLSSLIGFVVAYPLIHFYGASGAALTVCISRGLMGVLSFLKAKKYERQFI